MPKLIGTSNTLLLQYTGDWMGGEDAVRIGLASKSFPDDRLMEGAMELATRIAKGPTVAHSLTKYLVQQSMGLTFREALEMASAAQEHVRRTEDHKIGGAVVPGQEPGYASVRGSLAGLHGRCGVKWATWQQGGSVEWVWRIRADYQTWIKRRPADSRIGGANSTILPDL